MCSRYVYAVLGMHFFAGTLTQDRVGPDSECVASRPFAHAMSLLFLC